MAIYYPLTFPATIELSDLKLTLRPRTGRPESPFNFAGQAQAWNERWEMDGMWPAIKDDATLGEIEAFLGACGGGGTFVKGDPKRETLMGIGPAGGEFPTTRGANASGATVLGTRGWGVSGSGILKRGDHLQLAKNYLTFPRDFSNAAWVKNQCTVAVDTQDNPDPGTVNDADRVTPDGGATDAHVKQTVTIANIGGHTAVGKVWLKAATGTPSITIFLQDQVGGALGNQVCALTTSWQLFTVTAACPGTVTGIIFYIGGSSTWPVADGAVDLWGAMVYSPQVDARLVRYVGGTALNSSSTGETDTGVGTALDFLPRLRAALPEFSPVITAGAVGTWRLAPGFAAERSLELGLIARVPFAAVEAVTL
jgi:hypothetical protein